MMPRWQKRYWVAALFLVTIFFIGLTPLTNMLAGSASVDAGLHTTAVEAALPEGLQIKGRQIAVLGEREAEQYRKLFFAARAGAKEFLPLARTMRDQRLVPMATALWLQNAKTQVSSQDVMNWLKRNADQPQAKLVYAMARKAAAATGLPLPEVTAPRLAAATVQMPTRGLRPAIDEDHPAYTAIESRQARALNRILQQHNPAAAHASLLVIEPSAVSTSWLDEAFAAVAAAYYFDGNLPQAKAMLAVHGQETELGRWISGLVAWRTRDMAEALQQFVALSKTEGTAAADRSAAAFWGYRAAKRLGQSSQADGLLKVAVKLEPQGFYGLMANAILQSRPPLNWAMPEFTQQSLALLAKDKLGWQGLALLQIGERDLAEYELRHINARKNEKLRLVLLALAHRAQMPSLLLQVGGLGARPADGAAYPMPPWRPMNGFAVDRSLLYAIMRQESRFNPAAGSDSGAKGLMQLMPDAVEQIVGAPLSVDSLLDPTTNLTIGESYLLHLSKRADIKGSLLATLAAYNAGPSRVARWLKDPDYAKDPLLFIESIPFTETRDYVEQVMSSSWIYASRLQRAPVSMQHLLVSDWPKLPREPTLVKTADAALEVN